MDMFSTNKRSISSHKFEELTLGIVALRSGLALIVFISLSCVLNSVDVRTEFYRHVYDKRAVHVEKHHYGKALKRI